MNDLTEGLEIYDLKLQLWAVSSSEKKAQRQFGKLCELGQNLGVKRVLVAAIEMQAAGFTESEALDAIRKFLSLHQHDISVAIAAFPSYVAASINAYRGMQISLPDGKKLIKSLEKIARNKLKNS